MPQPSRDELVKTAQSLLDAGKSPDEVRAAITALTQQPQGFWDKHPTFAEGARAVLSSLPAIGGVVGGLLGTPADIGTGPGGTIVGAGLGTAAGKGAENLVLRLAGLGGPRNVDEGLSSVTKAGVGGATAATVGLAVPAVLAGAAKAANPMSIADDMDKSSLLKPFKSPAGLIRRFVQGAEESGGGSAVPVRPASANFPSGDVLEGQVTEVPPSPTAPTPLGLPPKVTAALPTGPGAPQGLPPAGAIQQPPSSLPPTQALPPAPTPAGQLGPASSIQLPASSIERELANQAHQEEIANSTPYERLGRDSTVPPDAPAPAQTVKDTAGQDLSEFTPEEVMQAHDWHDKGISTDDIVKRILAMRQLAAGSPAVAGMPGNAQMASEILSRSTED